MLKQAARALDRLLFPRAATCLGCGDQSGCAQDWLCSSCAQSLRGLWRGDMSTPTSPPLSRLAYAYAYRGPVPGLVRALKYGSAGCLAGFMAADMARACAALQLPQTPLAVPAPMHPRRERKRGYNQAELLCRELARMLGCPYAQALRKLRNTRQQARLDHEARTRNLEGSVGVCADVRGRVILLVDDVYTTGATMRVCASALLAAGAKAVDGRAYAGAGQARPASDLGKGLEPSPL